MMKAIRAGRGDIEGGKIRQVTSQNPQVGKASGEMALGMGVGTENKCRGLSEGHLRI